MTDVRVNAGSQGAAAPHRFRLNRAGVLNVWQYDEQEFRFAQGRLLLRGANGAGKSKTLEMLLPFVLDGDKARITASARHHTSLLWLMTDGYAGQARIGYLWVEFARTTAEGHREHYTCGVGIRASASAKTATAWFFTTPWRVGHELQLEDEAGPLTRSRLAERLGEHGHVFEAPRQYKEHVGRTLFGLSPEQYDDVLRLLYWLRQPQVGEDIEPARLSGQLAQALPQLDEQSVRAAGDTFDSLAAFGEQLERRGAAAQALNALAASYAGYARSVAAVHGRAVLKALEDERRAAAMLRRSAAALKDVTDRHQGTAAEKAEVTDRREEDRARLEQLRASPEARDQRRLDELTKQVAVLDREVQRAQDRADNAATRLESRSRRVGAEGSRLAAAVARLADSGRDAEREIVELRVEPGLAVPAGLDRVALGQPLSPGGTSVDTVIGGLERLGEGVDASAAGVGRREAAVVVVREAWQQVADAQRDVDIAALRAAEAESRWEQSRQRLEEAAGTVETEELALLTGLRAWLAEPEAQAVVQAGAVSEDLLPDGGLPESLLPEDLLSESLARMSGLVGTAVARRLTGLRSRESQWAAELSGAESVLAELAARRAAVAAEADPSPPGPALERTPRPDGAPLWRLVDFAAGVGQGERAGLEAALQSAGLLDAWIRPDGAVLDGAHRDTVLPLGPEAGGPGDGPAGVVTGGAEGPSAGPTLAEVLAPDCPPGSDVAPGVVEGVLRRVHLGRPRDASTVDDRSSAPAWVALDGEWRLGPLQGRAAKERAQYVGATARAAERRRRLDEIDAEAARVEQRRSGAGAELEDVRAQITGLEAWAGRQPSDAALARARTRLEERAATAERDTEAHTVAQQEATRARSRLAGIRQEATRLAAQHELPTDVPALGALAERLRQAGQRLRGLREAAQARGGELRRWGDERVELEAEAEEVAGLGEEVVERSRTAAAVAAALEELRSTVGAGVQALQDRLSELEEAVRAAGPLLNELDRRVDALAREVGAAESSLREAQESAAAARVARSAEVRQLGGLAAVPGLLESAFADGRAADVAGQEEQGQPLPERAVFAQAADQVSEAPVPPEVAQVADRLAGLADAGSAPDGNQVWKAYNEATSGPAADHEPRVVPMGGLLAVTARDEAGESPIAVLAPRVSAAVEHDRALLTAKEKAQFEQHILGELGEAIRRRRLESADLVEGMNRLLAGVTTSQGVRVRLDWRLRDDVPAEARQAVKLLTQPLGALIPEERAALRDALHRLIDASRAQTPELSYTEHLAVALDYRAWFAFRIRYTRPEADGAWQDLHRRSALSQGEQKVLCYLPLFAAAAAHFTSLAGAAPHAPRLVLLDDAFPKIDVRTHPLLFGLLVDLDLDFVVTSERLWGDHDTVPSLAIYEALRDPTQRGIAQFEYRWDGQQLVVVG